MLQQIVTFNKKEIEDLLSARAKEIIKAETGKDPTGSSHIAFQGTAGPNDTIEVSGTVTFNCNGKRV